MSAPASARPPSGIPDGITGSVGPIHVPSLNDTERAELLEQLRDWVAALVTRYDIDTRVIPPCWERHNGMVEALTALRDLERDCYAPNATPAAGVDWFRGLREIEAHLIEIASLTNCSRTEHRSPPQGWGLQHADAEHTQGMRSRDPGGR